MSEPPAAFGLLLRHARKAAGLTQEELAERAGVSWRSISELERSSRQRPRTDTVALLVQALTLSGEEQVAFEAAARQSRIERVDQDGALAARHPVAGAPPLPHGRFLGALPATPLVAREAEAAHISAAFDAASRGEGQLLLLAGEPGVGKTRLAQEAMVLGLGYGYRMLAGRCYEEHRAAPFSPFLEVLAQAWILASPALCQEAPRRFPELARLLPDRLPRSYSQEQEGQHLRLLRAITGFLTAVAAEAPLALLLDDLHWADISSVDLLQHLARGDLGRSVVLLGTYRDSEVTNPHPLRQAIAHLLRERLAEVLPVCPLSPAGTRTLISVQFSGAPISDDLAALVQSRTEGNPFFIGEVLKAWVEAGMIFREDIGWARKHLASLVVPFSVAMVVEQRVGHLPERAQALLRMASVLGQEFDLEVLLAAQGYDLEQVTLDIDATLAARLLEERQLERGVRYRFVHALVAQTLYESLPRHRLRHMHLRAAAALEQGGGQGAEWTAGVGRHYQLGGDTQQASHYLEMAGDDAARLYAFVEAEGYYRQALAARERLGDRLAIAVMQRKLGGALASCQLKFGGVLGSGRHQELEEARSLLAQARLMLEDLDAAAELALVYQALAWTVLNLREALHFVEQALALWPEAREDRDLLVLLFTMADILGSGFGDHAAAASYLERATALAGKLGDSQGRLYIMVADCNARFEQGTTATRMFTMLTAAEVAARRDGDAAAHMSLTFIGAYIHMLAGHPREARTGFLHAVESAGQSPDDMALHLALAAEMSMALGDWQEARMLLDRSCALHPLYVHELRRSWVAGDHAGSLEAARQGIQTLRRHGHTKYLIVTLALLADASLQLGRMEEAEHAARAALELAKEHDLWGFTGRTHGPLAEAVVYVGAADAEAVLRHSIQRVQQFEHFLARPALLRAHALLLARQGNTGAAVAALEESAACAREQGAAVQLARTLALLEEMAHGIGNETLVANAAAERTAIVHRIGPETRGLTWAR